MIVLHYTGMATGEAALERLRDPAAKVSAHYLVEEDGRVFALVPEERRAWHAGVSSWRGETDINGRSIGIEIVNPGHEFGYRDFPDVQIAAVIDLLTDIRSRWTIPDALIVAHSDVAPARKQDPGERFPWRRLAEAGHGLWADPDPAPGLALGMGDEGLGVLVLQNALARLGYALSATGQFDEDTANGRHRLPTPLGATPRRRPRRRRDASAADDASPLGERKLNRQGLQGRQEPSPELDALARTVVDAGLAVHRELGPGLLESSYEFCLAHELSLRGIASQRQLGLPVNYKGAKLELGYRLDLLVANQIVVEVKAIEAFTALHEAQLLTYMKLTRCQLGFLMNFNVALFKNGLRRFVV